MGFLGFLVGAVVGAVVVYNVWLDPIEQVAYHVFIESVKIEMPVFSAEDVWNSATFKKMGIGALIGGIVGAGALKK